MSYFALDESAPLELVIGRGRGGEQHDEVLVPREEVRCLEQTVPAAFAEHYFVCYGKTCIMEY